MSIPKYDEMYRAFLDCLADGQAHKSKEVKDIVAGVFDISAKEREEMLPSGKQPLFDNRIGWTRTYLKKAGLIQSPSRGVYIITPIGLQVLAENPQKIDNLYLQRFESFREFLSPNSDGTTTPTHVATLSSQTPQDILDDAFKRINATLVDDILAEVMKQGKHHGHDDGHGYRRGSGERSRRGNRSRTYLAENLCGWPAGLHDGL